MAAVGIITRIGRAPGVRRLVRKRDGDGVVTESPDPEDRDPRWCAACGREVLLGLARCLHCGGPPPGAPRLGLRRRTAADRRAAPAARRPAARTRSGTVVLAAVTAGAAGPPLLRVRAAAH